MTEILEGLAASDLARVVALNKILPSARAAAKLIQSSTDFDELWNNCLAEHGKEESLDELLDWAEKEIERADDSGIEMILPSAFPERLLQISDPPLLLYVRGRIPDDMIGVALVGSRKASPYGLTMSERLGADLSAQGITVVSGLAYGCDAAAHRASHAGAGATVAVLGSGMAQLYPSAHRGLAEKIVEDGGAVVSEYPLDTAPRPYTFPRRNRLVAGMSEGVCVVEASAKSGALITARLGYEYNRFVWAVPHNVAASNGAGGLALLRDGAGVARNAEDILEDLAPVLAPSLLRNPSRDAIINEEFLENFFPEGSSFDDVLSRSGLSREEVHSRILRLELEGAIKTMPGGLYRRCHN